MSNFTNVMLNRSETVQRRVILAQQRAAGMVDKPAEAMRADLVDDHLNLAVRPAFCR
jgi:hypothetical protein